MLRQCNLILCVLWIVYILYFCFDLYLKRYNRWHIYLCFVFMKKVLLSLAVLCAAIIWSTFTAFAAPQNADVSVQIQGPSTTSISIATTYNATVKNNGPSTATNIQLIIDFPLTNTSPQVLILGNVVMSSTGCQIINNKMICAIGSLKKGKTRTISYQYTAPVSTKTLAMTGTVSSALNDPNTSNNVSSFIPNFTYPVRTIVSANMLNSHCAGTNLTSYFECLAFPSSISSHETTLNADGSITFSEPGYSGFWSQPSSHQLYFEYHDVSGKIVEFSGFAINGANCFDGLTQFFPSSVYVAPYHVCIQ